MSLWDYVEQGGAIIYVLLILNLFGLTIILWRGFSLYQFRKNMNDYIAQFVEHFKSQKLQRDHAGLVILKDKLSDDMKDLEVGLNTVKIIATISPLLGLLGTVWGILTAFHVISQEGLDNPALFAGGISTALITTVGGLIVAIIHYIAYHYLSGIIDATETHLEKDIVPQVFNS